MMKEPQSGESGREVANMRELQSLLVVKHAALYLLNAFAVTGCGAAFSALALL